MPKTIGAREQIQRPITRQHTESKVSGNPVEEETEGGGPVWAEE